ncbi:MAG: hypothetical protein ACD_28C00001G0014 [uncultured bacterium]|nr:MAG: hypothetical protein ACD_28C00001G0014 [uncultured bacterium]KKT74475.1 MAG: hypothetical protein UW70_C0053G0003 [Candidatus Peregrinibacteria bacterium GW2011_GWA2_44_7]
MWTAQHSLIVKSTPEKVWQVWRDVEHWNSWDASIQWSKMEGPFEVGTKGVVKAQNGPAARFKITECTLKRSFTTSSRLPLATLHFIHTLKPTKAGVELIHTIEMVGPLTFFFARCLGKSLAEGVPKAMRKLKKQIES